VRLDFAGLADFAVIEEARARLQLLEADWSGLRLEPTAADLAAMQVDGALAEVVEELRGLQAQPDHAAVASEALKLLFDLVRREGAGA